MSERTSKWPSTYVPILGCFEPLWGGEERKEKNEPRKVFELQMLTEDRFKDFLEFFLLCSQSLP